MSTALARLAAAREQAGLSQEAMGRHLGVSQVTVHRWESPNAVRRGMTVRDAERYLAVIGQQLTVQPSDLEPDFVSCLEGMLKALEFTQDDTVFWQLHSRILRQLAAMAWQRVNPHTPAQRFSDLLGASSLGDSNPVARAAREQYEREREARLTGMAEEQADWDIGASTCT